VTELIAPWANYIFAGLGPRTPFMASA
jgi:hypothetical protein